MADRFTQVEAPLGKEPWFIRLWQALKELQRAVRSIQEGETTTVSGSGAATEIIETDGPTTLPVGGFADGEVGWRHSNRFEGRSRAAIDSTAVHSGDSAGGSVGGTYPTSLTVTKLNETGGPTALTIGAIPDGQVGIRTGATFVGSARSGIDSGAIHTGTSSEIHGLTEETAVAQDDEYLAENQSNTYSKIRVQAKNALAGFVASATTQVNFKSATAPTVNQIAKATGASTATWQAEGSPLQRGDYIGLYTVAYAMDTAALWGTFTATVTVPLKELRPCLGVACSNIYGGLTFDSGTYLVFATIGARATTNTAAAVNFAWKRIGNFTNTAQYTASVQGRNTTTASVGSGRPLSTGVPALVSTTAQETLFLVVQTVSAATWNVEGFTTSVVVIKTA